MYQLIPYVYDSKKPNRDTFNFDKVKEKEFDGIPINSNLANELQDFLLVDKWKTPSGETLTDFDRSILDLKRPENHELKVKVGLLFIRTCFYLHVITI